MKHKILWIASALSAICAVEIASAETIEEFLRAFHADPARMMQRLPSIVDENGVAHPRGYIDPKKLEEYLEIRGDLRDQIMGVRPMDLEFEDDSDPRGPNPDDEPDNVKDTPDRIVESGEILRNIELMELRKLTQSNIEKQPWTDSYWPINRGVTAYRYADPGAPNTRDYPTNKAYVLARPASSIAATGNTALINRLGPAEKYDYIMGDWNFTLSKWAWRKGEQYMKRYGRVPNWMGICHGWAAASSMNAPYPLTAITVRAVNGTPVKLYPNDVKALQSMLWAYSPPRARFAGSRCDVSNPRRDNVGRIQNPRCADVSPSTWHIAVVNQAAIHRRSLVADTTYDAQVWNFPLSSFKYRYFNPQTWQEAATLAAARVPKEKFKVDKFTKYRKPNGKYVVGVFMDVTFIKEIRPTTRLGVIKPPLKTVRYVYDLELDANMNIVGGEWYSNAHPDFLWTFSSNAQARSKYDVELIDSTWDGKSSVPSSWTNIAQNSSRKGIPLFTFLSRIVPKQEESTEEGEPGEEDTGVEEEEEEDGAPAPTPPPAPAPAS